jgi:hypothetical protein
MPRKIKPANRAKARNRTSWKPGQSGNPAGRPPSGQAFSELLRQIGDMSAHDLVAFMKSGGSVGKEIMALPEYVEVKFVAALRVWAALVEEPSAGLANAVFDRLEGKVPERISLQGQVDLMPVKEMLARVYGDAAIQENESPKGE